MLTFGNKGGPEVEVIRNPVIDVMSLYPGDYSIRWRWLPHNVMKGR